MTAEQLTARVATELRIGSAGGQILAMLDAITSLDDDASSRRIAIPKSTIRGTSAS